MKKTIHDVILPKKPDKLITDFCISCQKAEAILYKITEIVTPLVSNDAIEILNDNLGGFFGYIGKCLLTKDLYFDKLDSNHIDRLKRIIDYWQSFIADFPYFINYVHSFIKNIRDNLLRSFNTPIYFDNINDFLYFLEEIDYIQLILKSILYLNNDIGRQFLDDIKRIDTELKNVLTEQVVLDIVQKFSFGAIDDDLNYDYLPADFWWRKWKLR